MAKRKIRDELLDELEGAKDAGGVVRSGGGDQAPDWGAGDAERCVPSSLSTSSKRGSKVSPNRRNGASSKTLQTDHGPTEIEVPRDRKARFESQIVPKHVTRVIDGLDEKIMALHSRGLSTRDIQAQLSELYGTEISPTLVSRVTDAVQEEISEWQSSPQGWIAATRSCGSDALFVKMRLLGRDRSKPCGACRDWPDDLGSQGSPRAVG